MRTATLRLYKVRIIRGEEDSKGDHMKKQLKKCVLALLSLILVANSITVTGWAADTSEIYGAAKLTHNTRFNHYKLEYGIDVSHHQGKIDWAKVKKSGIDFVIIRVAARSISSGGGRIKDNYAQQNLKGATENNIPFGVYVYSQALTEKEAREEADWVLEEIAGYHPTLPVVFDYEYADGGRLKSSLSKTKKTNNCLAFCKKIEAAGYTPMLYANKSFLENSINAAAISQYYPIWLAHYSNSTSYTGSYEYWQYTSSGKVDGISKRVDMNVRYVGELKVTSAIRGKIALEWNSRENADGYELYRSENNGEYKLLENIEGQVCTYEDKSVKSDVEYVYRVRAILGDDQYSDYYTSQAVCAELLTVPKLQAGNTDFDQVTFSWQPSKLADGYEIWKYDTKKKQYVYKTYVAAGMATTYSETDLTASTNYSYRIRMYRMLDTTKQYSPFSNVLTMKTQASVKAKVTADTLNARAKASSSGKVLKTVKKGTILTITSSSGNWYCTSVTVSGKKKTVYVNKKHVKLIRVGKPTLTLKSNSFDNNKLKWTAVSGAAGYQVQRYNKSTKKYETIKTITKKGKVTCSDSSLNASANYQYRVRAWKVVSKKTIYGAWSNVLTAKTEPAVKGKTTAKVSVRKNAGTKYSVLKTVKKGTNLTITGSRGQWYRVSVTYKGAKRTGYVSKKYVRL